ncbi:MmcQ/YjbR family DNA-binding protein [Actinacidiphila acidipaludis]|uniref:MmcQ/YjbR family DNA-binding protein n=1 Tax=Actinacidiphila acidipaludis TaxID=2873382 RepID=A0ABS7Q4Z8_9ACTN|nr:MmcQ/YjbR family DNA-binding protein [Streptomyces acidipaludis]MBY8877789.1 MmcQ/YjbR family DNA-binding protein [Streptomyces acidipaludis]
MVTFEEFAGLALALPQAHERITWGSEHTFRVGEKIFAMGAPESAHVSLKASLEDQSELMAADPETFSSAPYVGRFGWVRVALARADAGELAELLTEAWRRTAPKRAVKAFDGAGGTQVADGPKGKRRA